MPNRKPTHLKRLHGTVKATRLNRFEPEPEGDLDAAPPDFLSPGQKDGWRYVMQHAPRSLLKALDRAVLVLWVEAEDRHRTAMMMQAMMDNGAKMPLLAKGKDGPIPSPYLRIMNHAALIMLRCCAELGFSPASRPRIQLIPGRGPALIDGDALDPWDELARDAA